MEGTFHERGWMLKGGGRLQCPLDVAVGVNYDVA